MKAWILHNPNNMTYEETEKPQPKSDEVLVAVKAAGICGSDIPRVLNHGVHFYPIVLGQGRMCIRLLSDTSLRDRSVRVERMWMRNGRVNRLVYFL